MTIIFRNTTQQYIILSYAHAHTFTTSASRENDNTNGTTTSFSTNASQNNTVNNRSKTKVKLVCEENYHFVVNRVIVVAYRLVTIESTYSGNAVVSRSNSVIDTGTVTYTINNMAQFSGKG